METLERDLAVIRSLGIAGISFYSLILHEKTPLFRRLDENARAALLSVKANAWQNSQVRASLSDDVRAYMDSLEKADLRAEMRLMRDEAARSGWAATKQAVELAYAATGRIDSASVAVSAARMAVDDAISYDEPIDLGEYDAVFKREA